MSNITSLAQHQEDVMQRKWERFRELDLIACATGRLEDAIAAGRARHEFYDLFDTPDQRRASVIYREFGKARR